MVKESLIVENKLRTIIKQEVRNILILNELNINKKSKLGSGQDFETYPSNKNPDRVIKSATTKYSSSNISNHINIFKKYPKYFPIVYKYNEKFAELEKLDLNPVKEIDGKIKKLVKINFIEKNTHLPENIKSILNRYPKIYGKNILEHLNFNSIGYINPNIKNVTNEDEAISYLLLYLIKQDKDLYNTSLKLKKLYDIVLNIIYNKENYRDVLDWGVNNVGVDNLGNFKMLDF